MPPTAPGSEAPADRADHPPAIYLLAAHPHWRDSRVNLRLRDAAQALPQVEVNDLYSSYPDFDIDVPAEQERLARADLLVLLHPIQWYSMPALQKLWFDEVLRWGWAYGPGGQALQGKDCWLVASTGGAAASFQPEGYNSHSFEDFLPPYEQTARLCGMRFLPPLLFHGANRATPQALAMHLTLFRERLASYPDWPGLAPEGAPADCAVPAGDRPVPGPAHRPEPMLPIAATPSSAPLSPSPHSPL